MTCLSQIPVHQVAMPVPGPPALQRAAALARLLLILAALTAGGVLLLVGRADAAHSPTAVHACAASNGALRLAEACNRREVALVLATDTEYPSGEGALAGRMVELESTVAALERTIAAQASAIADLESLVGGLDSGTGELGSAVQDLQTLLAGVTRNRDGSGYDTLRLSDMNLQIVNGTGTTNGAPNGHGNLLIGYNAPRPGAVAPQRTGSHSVIIGDRHHWTSYAHLLAGFSHSASGQGASITGGSASTASGDWSAVTGGFVNTARGDWSAVTGGSANVASGHGGSVTGGTENTASGLNAVVSSGRENTATGSLAFVGGGRENTAGGSNVSILGGTAVTVTTWHTCHPAC
jgi:hypothetical protein